MHVIHLLLTVDTMWFSIISHCIQHDHKEGCTSGFQLASMTEPLKGEIWDVNCECIKDNNGTISANTLPACSSPIIEIQSLICLCNECRQQLISSLLVSVWLAQTQHQAVMKYGTGKVNHLLWRNIVFQDCTQESVIYLQKDTELY